MVGTTYLQRIFTYFIALLREDLYQAYERPVRPQIYDLVADDKKNFRRPKCTTWSQMTERTFCGLIPPKVQSRRMGEWELADLKIRDTLLPPYFQLAL